MRKRVLTPALLLLATLGAAACSGGDAGTGPSGEGLTRADIDAINQAVLALSAGVAREGASGASRNATAAAGGTFRFEFDAIEPCDAGGTVRLEGEIAGSYDDQAHTATLNSDVSAAHQACGVRTEEGDVIRISGDPGIDLTLAASANAAGLTALRVTEEGAFTWDKGDGNNGRCTVDLVAELVAGTQNVHVVGSFCGVAIDATGPLED